MRFASVPPEAAAALDVHANEKSGELRVHKVADAPIVVSSTHPVYVAGASDVVAERVLANARLVAWRALVSAGTALAAAEVSPAGELASVTEGPFVEGTSAALDVARRVDGELRLLRIPAVYVVALWVHGDDGSDVLIPVAPAPPPLAANDPVSEAAFIAALRPLAEQVIAGPQLT